MSHRIWLGEAADDFADENLREYGSIEELVERGAWWGQSTYMKAYAPSREVMGKFLDCMADAGFHADDFMGLYVGHPADPVKGVPKEWVDYFSTPLKASLDAFETVTEILELISKEEAHAR